MDKVFNHRHQDFLADHVALNLCLPELIVQALRLYYAIQGLNESYEISYDSLNPGTKL